MKFKKFNKKIKIKLNNQLRQYVQNIINFSEFDDEKPEDILDKYFDDNFFTELIDDLCNTKPRDFLIPYLKKITKLLFSLSDEDIKRLTKKDYEKLYNYRTINYEKPITYKFFKTVLLDTLPLLKPTLLFGELLIYTNEIKEAFQIPVSLYATFDTKEFLGHYLALYFSDTLDYGTKHELLAFFRDNPQYYKLWGKSPELLNNYWFWIFMYDSLEIFFKDQLKNISNAAKIFAWESFKAGENKANLYFEDEEYKKELEKNRNTQLAQIKSVHNAYSSEEYIIIYQAKKAYKTIQNMYKFAKFITKSLSQSLNYKVAKNNLEKLALDEEYNMFLHSFNLMYDCDHNCSECEYMNAQHCTNINQEESFNKFKDFADNCLTIIYNTLFSQTSTLEKIYQNLEKTSKQEFALSIIRNIYPFFENKTNKTITNIFSNFDKINNEEEYFKTYKTAFYDKDAEITQKTEILVRALNTIPDSIEMFFKNPSQEKRVFIMMNIKQLEMLL